MLISICGRDLAPHSHLLEHAERRLRYALGRFGGRIQRVMVFLEDTNGPRGGLDKCCRMVARLKHPARDVVVEGHDAELTALIDRTADRLGQTISRELDCRRYAATPTDL